MGRCSNSTLHVSGFWKDFSSSIGKASTTLTFKTQLLPVGHCTMHTMHKAAGHPHGSSTGMTWFVVFSHDVRSLALGSVSISFVAKRSMCAFFDRHLPGRAWRVACGMGGGSRSRNRSFLEKKPIVIRSISGNQRLGSANEARWAPLFLVALVQSSSFLPGRPRIGTPTQQRIRVCMRQLEKLLLLDRHVSISGAGAADWEAKTARIGYLCKTAWKEFYENERKTMRSATV